MDGVREGAGRTGRGEGGDREDRGCKACDRGQ